MIVPPVVQNIIVVAVVTKQSYVTVRYDTSMYWKFLI